MFIKEKKSIIKKKESLNEKSKKHRKIKKNYSCKCNMQSIALKAGYKDAVVVCFLALF